MNDFIRCLHRNCACAALFLFALSWTGCSPTASPSHLRPALATEKVSRDADDPAIWIHPTDPARSLILGTNKTRAPDGALVVFGLDGKIRQTVAGLDRPNNVDVEYRLMMPAGPIDI